MTTGPQGTPALRVGFACHWQHDRPMTWSGTPWALREALRQGAEVVDVEVGTSKPVETALRVAGVRRHQRRWHSDWRQGRVPRAVAARRLRRLAPDAVDAVVQLQDLGVTRAPYYVLQDLSFALLQEEYGASGVPAFETLGRRRIDELRARQDQVYASATGLFPMSDWLARSLVRQGIDPARITVVNPGMNVAVDPSEVQPVRRQGPARRLLFVGRDFERKSGAQVVAAFELLRRELGHRITLTIAGPASWPLRRPPSDGVEFLGSVPATVVRQLLNSHDLFVMPSTFEGFGIVFAEALARGLPCVGRRACAMPEFIEPGVNGALVEGDDPQELAHVVADVLDDDAIYTHTMQRMSLTRQHFAWHRASAQILSHIRSA